MCRSVPVRNAELGADRPPVVLSGLVTPTALDPEADLIAELVAGDADDNEGGGS